MNNFLSDPIITQKKPEWIIPIEQQQIDNNFLKIIQFYLFNSPCKNSSWNRVSLADYGWVNCWSYQKFKDLIYENSELSKFNQAESKTDLKRIWPNITDYAFSQTEYAYYVKAGEENPLLSLCHRIRNSLAHGRFRFNNQFIFFEDVDNNGTIVSARINLKRETLVNWANIIKIENKASRDVFEYIKRQKERGQRNSQK